MDKCKGERKEYAEGTGSATYSGLRFSISALSARSSAGNADDAALAIDLQRAADEVCKNLCTPDCVCKARVEVPEFYSEKTDFIALSTRFGFTTGGTYIVKKLRLVIGECWKRPPSPGGSSSAGGPDVAPVTAESRM